MNIDPQKADISVNNQRANFNTRPYGDTPSKSKSCFISIDRFVFDAPWNFTYKFHLFCHLPSLGKHHNLFKIIKNYL